MATDVEPATVSDVNSTVPSVVTSDLRPDAKSSALSTVATSVPCTSTMLLDTLAVKMHHLESCVAYSIHVRNSVPDGIVLSVLSESGRVPLLQLYWQKVLLKYIIGISELPSDRLVKKANSCLICEHSWVAKTVPLAEPTWVWRHDSRGGLFINQR